MRRASLRRSIKPFVWSVLFPLAAVPLMGVNACGSSSVEVPMRDGVGLVTDVHTLRNPAPTIVMRTPYGRGGLGQTATILNNAGYSAVAQDMRGFGDSGGQFMMFTDDGWGANQDGYDTIEWTATNDWSSGDVCMWGASALGITSLLAAGSAPPHLRCVYALVASGDLYHQVAYWGGAMREEMVVNWLTGLGQLEALDAVETHTTDDAFWDPVSIQDRYASLNVPIYSVGGWYDIFSQGNLDVFSGADTQGGEGARGTQKLLLGPWSHASTGPTVGELTFPENSVLPAGEELRWFEHWLQGVDNGIDREPPVKYYLMGDVDTSSTSWNVWRTSEVWPVPSSPTPFYFLAGGGLSAKAPTAAASSDGFTFDPANPVPTVGGNNLTLPAGPYDQRSIENRSDVLVFTSSPLTQPLAITGRVTATLWVSSSATDTDFTVKLTDVYPDGRSMLVLDGIARARFREGFDREVLMTPGKIYPIEVDLWSTSLVFNAGHQIRVAVSSSNSPRFSVNPNTGGPLYQEDGVLEVADQVLYLDATHPSHLTLPVVGL